MSVLLSVAQMYRADRLAMEGSISGEDLMENAGWSVFREIRRRWSPRRVSVLCGPGNNGGDGFVIARLLERAGWPVKVGLLGRRDALKGDAAFHAARWDGTVRTLSGEEDVAALLQDDPLVVDALFGAGLARPLDGVALDCVRHVNGRNLVCVAVDMPSGVCGDSGAIRGEAMRAALSVTFFRPKPGHFLYPGRERAGELVVADIGISGSVLNTIRPQTFLNEPSLWRENLPFPGEDDHKYSRGAALIVGGSAMSGAARLSARGARRAGAGLVRVIAENEVLPLYQADDPGLLTASIETLDHQLAESRLSSVLIGPGAGVGEATAERALSILRSGKACVLDADALTSFATIRQTFFSALHERCLLTPHEGEFSRLFGIDGTRLEKAREAARTCGAVVVLKGADTVIAAPDGRAAVNANAPPDLATAGAGDVLAGIALGLMAQGMPVFEAGCAAVWMHGAAATAFGRGLIAEDLADILPHVWRELSRER